MSKDKIPRARRQLHVIADRLERKGDARTARAIRRAIRLMHRSKPVSRGKTHHRKMTKKIGNMVRAYHAKHPHLSQTQIGNHFNVDKGRVSEALNGEWI